MIKSNQFLNKSLIIKKMPTLEKWYALSVIAGSEEKTKRKILERLKKADQKVPGLELICPDEEVMVKTRGGEEKKKRKMTLPGYMLVRCRSLDETSINLIGQVKGVIEFMGGNQNPTELPEEEVKRILHEKTSAAVEKGRELFSEGDEVTITAGPLQGFVAVVEEIQDGGKMAVQVEIFGRTTKAQLESSQVKPV